MKPSRPHNIDPGRMAMLKRITRCGIGMIFFITAAGMDGKGCAPTWHDGNIQDAMALAKWAGVPCGVLNDDGNQRLVNAAAVAYAESNLETNAGNGIAYGIWQVNYSAHKSQMQAVCGTNLLTALYDPN